MSRLPLCTAEEFNAAVANAQDAFAKWRGVPVPQRARVMLRLQARRRRGLRYAPALHQGCARAVLGVAVAAAVPLRCCQTARCHHPATPPPPRCPQELINRHTDELAASITREQGKTLADARGDVFRGLGAPGAG